MISGTGPFEFVSRDTNDDGADDSVVFKSFDDHWNGDADVDFVHVVRYDSASDVYDALIDGELDAVIGAGVLDPVDVYALTYNDDFDTQHTGPMMNSVVIINSDVDLNVRKAIVHAVNKGQIIDEELGGIEQPIYQLFPEAAPYCDVYLTPKFDYDFEKAYGLQNCPDDSCEADCEDDESWFKNGSSSKDCDYVAKKPTKHCTALVSRAPTA